MPIDEDRKLTVDEEKIVELYTNDKDRKFYGDKQECYHKVTGNKTKARVNYFFKLPHIKKAIAEATILRDAREHYSKNFVNQELYEQYEAAKSAGQHAIAQKYLFKMADILGMLKENNSTTEVNEGLDSAKDAKKKRMSGKKATEFKAFLKEDQENMVN